MNEWLKGWLASEAATHDKIEVKRIYIDLNEGNLYDGVIFSQIMYWHGTNRENGKPRMTIERDGELWLAKGYGDWLAECRIVEATARKCINRIEKRGLIVKKLWKFNNAPTVHIRIDWDQLEEQLKLICPDVSNGFDTRGQIGIDTTGQIDLIPDSKSLTETTSQTTTKNTRKKKTATPSKKNGWANEDALIQEWARIRNMNAAAIGATLETPKRRASARRMLKWSIPLNAADIADAIKVSKSTDYEFTWLEEDVPKRRGLRANTPVVIPETPIEIVPPPPAETGEPIDRSEEGKRIMAELVASKDANSKPHDPYGGWKPAKVIA